MITSKINVSNIFVNLHISNTWYKFWLKNLVSRLPGFDSRPVKVFTISEKIYTDTGNLSNFHEQGSRAVKMFHYS